MDPIVDANARPRGGVQDVLLILQVFACLQLLVVILLVLSLLIWV
jgi:hypothetical protein